MANTHPESRAELTELLERFAVRPIEQQAYLHVLTYGPQTVSPIAKAIEAPVSTTQAVMDRLVRLGIMDFTLRGNRRVFQAADPVKFKRIAERHVQDATRLMDVLAVYRAEKPADLGRVRVYPRERIADVLHRILAAKSKEVWEIVSAHDMQELMGERFHFTKRRVQQGIRLKSLRVESKEIKRYSKLSHQRELREARFLPATTSFRASFALWDNTVVFYPVKREGMIVVIESVSLCEMLRELYEILWSVSRRMETAAS